MAIADKFLLVRDANQSTSDDSRGQRSRENESRGIGTNGVDHISRPSDIAANDTISLAEGPGNDIDSVHNAPLEWLGALPGSKVGIIVEVLGYASSTWSIHANGVNLRFRVLG